MLTLYSTRRYAFLMISRQVISAVSGQCWNIRRTKAWCRASFGCPQIYVLRTCNLHPFSHNTRAEGHSVKRLDISFKTGRRVPPSKNPITYIMPGHLGCMWLVTGTCIPISFFHFQNKLFFHSWRKHWNKLIVKIHHQNKTAILLDQSQNQDSLKAAHVSKSMLGGPRPLHVYAR